MKHQISNTERVTVHDKFMVIDGESVETGSFNSPRRRPDTTARTLW